MVTVIVDVARFMACPAFLAIYWFVSFRLEGYFAFQATVGADHSKSLLLVKGFKQLVVS